MSIEYTVLHNERDALLVVTTTGEGVIADLFQDGNLVNSWAMTAQEIVDEAMPVQDHCPQSRDSGHCPCWYDPLFDLPPKPCCWCGAPSPVEVSDDSA